MVADAWPGCSVCGLWPLRDGGGELELGLVMGSLIGDNIVNDILASDRPCMS